METHTSNYLHVPLFMLENPPMAAFSIQLSAHVRFRNLWVAQIQRQENLHRTEGVNRIDDILYESKASVYTNTSIEIHNFHAV